MKYELCTGCQKSEEDYEKWAKENPDMVGTPLEELTAKEITSIISNITMVENK